MSRKITTLIVSFSAMAVVVALIGCGKKDEKKADGKPPVLTGTNVKGKTTTNPNEAPAKKKDAAVAAPAVVKEFDGLWTSQCLTQYEGWAPHKMVMRIENGTGYWRVLYYSGENCSNENFQRTWYSDEFSISLAGNADVDGFKKVDYAFDDGGVHYNILGIFPGNPSKRMYEGNTTDARDASNRITDGTSAALRPTRVDYRVEYSHAALPQ